jgi:hypothetical protein
VKTAKEKKIMMAKVTLGIGYPGANHEDEIEIDDTELAECETEAQKEKLLDEYWRDWANNYIDGGIDLIEN